MAGSAESKLDVSGADKKVWLLKVPGIVAQSWRATCEASMKGEAPPGQELGRILITPNATESTGDYELTLAGAGLPAGVPSSYKMRAQTAGLASMQIFAEQEGNLSVQGQVEQKFDVIPSGGAADPQYRMLNRERNVKAATKTRTLQMIDDPRALLRRAAMPISVSIASKRKATAGKGDHGLEKRARIAKDELEQQLFRLFEKQAHYTFTQLIKETDQPVAWLKEVLGGVAQFHKRGPHSGLWELKREYRHGGTADNPNPV